MPNAYNMLVNRNRNVHTSPRPVPGTHPPTREFRCHNKLYILRKNEHFVTIKHILTKQNCEQKKNKQINLVLLQMSSFLQSFPFYSTAHIPKPYRLDPRPYKTTGFVCVFFFMQVKYVNICVKNKKYTRVKHCKF